MRDKDRTSSQTIGKLLSDERIQIVNRQAKVSLSTTDNPADVAVTANPPADEKTLDAVMRNLEIIGEAALRSRFDKHTRLARMTFPIWLYVSVTGVVIYWWLYRVNP